MGAVKLPMQPHRMIVRNHRVLIAAHDKDGRQALPHIAERRYAPGHRYLAGQTAELSYGIGLAAQTDDQVGEVCRTIPVHHGLKLLIILVDAVGIEPTTCRLRATEFASPPAAIVCYKPLYKIHLRAAQKLLLAIHTA